MELVRRKLTAAAGREGLTLYHIHRGSSEKYVVPLPILRLGFPVSQK